MNDRNSHNHLQCHQQRTAGLQNGYRANRNARQNHTDDRDKAKDKHDQRQNELVLDADQPQGDQRETGIEEFLADGIIVLYNIQKRDARENAIEVVKMRYGKHQKKMVLMTITDNGIKVHPDKCFVIES